MSEWGRRRGFLEWTACSDTHQCARLNVPLNYSEPHAEKAVIAIIRYPATVPADSPLYRGPILFNPGGPGGSGVAFIESAGPALAQLVGPEFDIIGFDPRGVARSTPRVSLFETDAERALWPVGPIRDLNASEDAVARHWARAQITGRLASETAASYLPHINTENTARDMLRIVEAHGREKLQYWGFSYGTVLGAVFASIFPDKVERLIIDGVVDTEDYFDTMWANNLIDADKALQTFFDGCFAAGPNGCAFYAPTPEAIAQNLTDLYESVRARPVPVRTASHYGLVDFELLHDTMLSILYAPLVYFDFIPDALAALARGDGGPLLDAIVAAGPRPFECSCDSDKEQFEFLEQAASLAILCNDGRAVPFELDEAERHYKSVAKTSSFGSLFASIRIACSGWPDLPKKHFQGPVGGNTSVPLLLIGNTAGAKGVASGLSSMHSLIRDSQDPVTSLWAAKKTAKAFPKSVVLTQDCAGHSSLAAPSLCTRAYVREYFLSGALPEPDTVCPVLMAGSVFRNEEQETPVGEQETFSANERDVFDAFQAVQRKSWFGPPRFLL
ncbi:alpha/beta hydrolase fold-domain-containing protein [Mycena albidolilacea]|uniref:Alpha/beta hydrolase fold-domain-containing protein n=1 Tax=Mycena albidolilacea TaxID=1033008 RepID=A0AAD6ZFI2_9AGAR|nr:alpha/beta hydrolase fold-domain-containing protein [Mycena albidolilacea]